MSDQEQSQVDDQQEEQQRDMRVVLPPNFRPTVEQVLAGDRIAIDIMRQLIELHATDIPDHTSAPSGEDWVQELLSGNPERLHNELGVYRGTFMLLLKALDEIGLRSSPNTSIEEQLAIFLYTVVTGLTCRHVGERFQWSHSTITKYFKLILQAFSTPPFYTTYVQLPAADSPTPPEIQNSPKFYPFFESALGAIDGKHITCMESAEDSDPSRNCKGVLTQNCLMACTFDLRFTYILSSWEGSTTGSTLFRDARETDFYIPRGKYYLADTGFASSDALLVPYRNVRYHLSEWGNDPPRNQKELFNLRHASARNVVERIFGILKKRFKILHFPPEYDMRIQAQIPAALAALHNFIRRYDPDEIYQYVEGPFIYPIGSAEGVGELGAGPVTPAETSRANARRVRIAREMWEQYQQR